MLRRVGKSECEGFGRRARRGIGPHEGVGMGEAQGVASGRIDGAMLLVFREVKQFGLVNWSAQLVAEVLVLTLRFRP